MYLYQIVKRERNLSRHRYCPPVLFQLNYYLNPQKNENGGYSNFQSTSFRGAIELTEEQAKTFLAYNGFVTIQRIENEETGEIGTLVEPNMEAWEAWRAAQAEQPEEPELEQPVTWASMAAAIRKGVNEID